MFDRVWLARNALPVRTPCATDGESSIGHSASTGNALGAGPMAVPARANDALRLIREEVAVYMRQALGAKRGQRPVA